MSARGEAARVEIVFLLIGISLLVVAGIAWLLFWAVRTGQYDDLEAPRHQILMDDDDTRRPSPDAEQGQSGRDRD